MEIGIIGAGSVGMLFAAYLSRFFTVTLYTRTNDHAEMVNLNGIFLKKPSGQTHVKIKALPIEEWNGIEEITIIAVKQYQLPTIIDKINQLDVPPQSLLFVQNGMGHLKWLETLKGINLFVGSVEHGALREGNCTVWHNGEGQTNVAVFKGEPHPLFEIARAASANFPVIFHTDYMEMLKNKLIVNAVINPLTALLKEENGELLANPHYFQVLKSLFYEIANILNLESPEMYLDQIIGICKNTAKNRSSMLKDFEAGNLTEVDAILGYVIEEAKRKDIKAPQVESFYHLIKGKEGNKVIE